MMVQQTGLMDELRAIAGAEHAGDPADRDLAVDGVAPAAWVAPGSYDEVAAVLRFANENRLAVVPRGGGRLAHVGNVPRAYDIALDLTRLNRVLEYEPADLTATCQAGITVERLQQQVGAAGQLVPFSMAGTADTVGGLLALNTSSLRAAYGTPRDFTIGLRVVTPEGKTVRAGGKVVKNVAGYDMCKLHIGAMGTLGVIVEATFKLFPRPAETGALHLRSESAAALCSLVADVRRRGFPLQETTLRRVAGSPAYVLEAGFAGSTAAVRRTRDELQRLAADASAEIVDPDPKAPAAPGAALALTGRVLPSDVPALIAAWERESPDSLEADPALGEVSASWTTVESGEQLVARLRESIAPFDGATVVTRCPPGLKQSIDVFGPPPQAFPLMRSVKQQFDPNGTLNPGRQVGRL